MSSLKARYITQSPPFLYPPCPNQDSQGSGPLIGGGDLFYTEACYRVEQFGMPVLVASDLLIYK